MNGYITAKMAAAMLGYSLNYFRKTFCNESHPLLPIISRRGRGNRRTIFVSKAAVEALLPEKTG